MLATRGMGSESLVTNGLGYWGFGTVVAQAVAVSHTQDAAEVAAFLDAAPISVTHENVVDVVSVMLDAIADGVSHIVVLDSAIAVPDPIADPTASVQVVVLGEPAVLPDAIAEGLVHRPDLNFPFSIDGLARLVLSNETRMVSLADGTVIYVVSNVSKERKATNVTKQVKVN